LLNTLLLPPFLLSMQSWEARTLIRGILPLALLTEIETQRGQCADLFDMVAGTSIGGIIAAGLAHRVPAKTIRDMLTNDGGTIFASPTLGLLGPKYDAAPLEGFLNQTFGGAMLNGITKPELMVPTVDLIRPTSMFFKSWRARQDASYNFALKDVTRATSAAETYFAPADITSASGEKYCWSTAAQRSTIQQLPRYSRPKRCGPVSRIFASYH
jgi:patatin-like phospholipase/acyl hydrolase